MTPLRRRRAALPTLIALVAALAATTGDDRRLDVQRRTTPPAERIAAEPPRLALFPPTGARDVVPTDATRVEAHSGTLTDVRLVNEEGRTVAGAMTPDAKAWRPAVPLGYGLSLIHI